MLTVENLRKTLADFILWPERGEYTVALVRYACNNLKRGEDSLKIMLSRCSCYGLGQLLEADAFRGLLEDKGFLDDFCYCLKGRIWSIVFCNSQNLEITRFVFGNILIICDSSQETFSCFLECWNSVCHVSTLPFDVALGSERNFQSVSSNKWAVTISHLKQAAREASSQHVTTTFPKHALDTSTLHCETFPPYESSP